MEEIKKHKCYFNDLNNYLLENIASYLFEKKNNFYIPNDNNFFYSCIFLYNLKYTFFNFYFKFNKVYSVKYYQDEDFRKLINSKINIKKQLGLYLICFDSVLDTNILSDVHTLDLTNSKTITDVSALGNVHNLDLSWCENITDVSALSNVRILDLSCCNKLLM